MANNLSTEVLRVSILSLDGIQYNTSKNGVSAAAAQQKVISQHVLDFVRLIRNLCSVLDTINSSKHKSTLDWFDLLYLMKQSSISHQIPKHTSRMNTERVRLMTLIIKKLAILSHLQMKQSEE